MTNLPARLSTLDQQITDLSERLQPPRREFIAECLVRLKAGGLMVPKGIRAEDFIDEYTLALAHVPLCGLAAAVSRIKRGEIELKGDFMPIPGKLAAMAHAEASEVREDRRRAIEMKRAIAEQRDQEINYEERERQKARVRELYAAFKEKRLVVVDGLRVRIIETTGEGNYHGPASTEHLDTDDHTAAHGGGYLPPDRHDAADDR